MFFPLQERISANDFTISANAHKEFMDKALCKPKNNADIYPSICCSKTSTSIEPFVLEGVGEELTTLRHFVPVSRKIIRRHQGKK